MRAWILAVAENARTIDDARERAGRFTFAAESLAERGHERDARRLLKELFRSVLPPSSHPSALVSARTAAAEIMLILKDETAARAHLESALAAGARVTRRCDKGYAGKAVLEILVDAGLAAPETIEDQELRRRAAFNREWRRADEAIGAGDTREARDAIVQAERTMRGGSGWQMRYYRLRVLRLYARLGDRAAVRRVLRSIPRTDLSPAAEGKTLWELGLKGEALRIVDDDLHRHLRELRTMDDPNYHFPAMAIERALNFLIDVGERRRAERELSRVLDESRRWNVDGWGFASAAVYRSLAGVVAKLRGPQAAMGLLDQAMSQARAERSRDWRAGAFAETVDLYEKMGMFDEALTLARRMRAREAKRNAMAKLLAQAGRWRELREVLSEAKDPKEASELAWWVALAIEGKTQPRGVLLARRGSDHEIHRTPLW